MMKNFAFSLFYILTVNIYAQNLSALYEQVNPAVVVIFTEEKDLVNTGFSVETVTSDGLGSGFMISDKQIITASHVVNVAEKVQVQFLDGEVIPAKVISSFKTADVALIELVWPKKEAKTLKLADSDALKIGEQVFIVGAPFGLEHSLSSGYVSGRIKDRPGKNPFQNLEYIQTDASINEGNSGGPMMNLKGEVVGIVSHILTKSGGFEGIGFATSSNLAKELLLERQILWTGMDAVPVTGKLADMLNVPQRSGLLVQKVVFISPLGTMGLQGGDTKAIINNQELILGGDIILSFNGVPFDVTDEALLKIAEVTENREQNSPYEIEVLRAGKVITLKRN
ncbi:MAG: trypsin-like peptidase domain-containing protein [Bacteroidota bacterium]